MALNLGFKSKALDFKTQIRNSVKMGLNRNSVDDDNGRSLMMMERNGGSLMIMEINLLIWV